jgi:hypothetical protein
MGQVMAYQARRYKVGTGHKRVLEGRAPPEVLARAVATGHVSKRLSNQIAHAFYIEERHQAWVELHRQRALELWATRWKHRKKPKG